MDDQILGPGERQDLPESISASQTPQPWYKSKLAIWSMIAAVVLIGAISWYFIWGRTPQATPESNNVTVLIKGPAAIASDAEAEYHILYHNGENADLTDVSLNMIYPTNFTFKSATPASTTSAGITFNLPILRQGRDGEVVIRGKLKGGTGDDKEIQAKLNYKLSNFNSNFEVDQTYHTTIQAPNWTFDITGPTEVPVGQSTTFTVNYANVSSQDYDNVAVGLTYPTSFSFAQASQIPSKNNNYWTIGKLPKNASGHIDITGTFMGQNSDQQMVSAQLGLVISNTFAPQINSTATFKLKSAPIGLTQTAEPSDIVSLGQQIQYTINYSNESEIGLTNLVITDTINSNLIDSSRMQVPDAVIVGNTITWKSATSSGLALLTPGQHGQLQFTLPLKQNLTVTAKNQVITNSIKVVSSEITTPIQAADLTVKLATNLNLAVTGNYISGALPMQVGKTTVFAITYLLTNTTDDLDGVNVDASLPLPPSSWKNVIIPSSESARLSFDPTSGKIRWNVGALPAFTGKLTPAAKVTFQLAVTPQPSDQGQSMKLLSDITTAAADNFTNQNINLTSIYQFTTSDIDDPLVQSKGSTVQ